MRNLQVILFIIIIIGLYVLGIYCLMRGVNLLSIAVIGVPICLTGIALSSMKNYIEKYDRFNSYKKTK